MKTSSSSGHLKTEQRFSSVRAVLTPRTWCVGRGMWVATSRGFGSVEAFVLEENGYQPLVALGAERTEVGPECGSPPHHPRATSDSWYVELIKYPSSSYLLRVQEPPVNRLSGWWTSERLGHGVATHPARPSPGTFHRFRQKPRCGHRSWWSSVLVRFVESRVRYEEGEVYGEQSVVRNLEQLGFQRWIQTCLGWI